MSGFSSLGVGSGLDLETLVQGLVRAERQPVEARLNRGRSAAQTRLSALGSLKSAVAGLATAVKALQDLRVGVSASSSDSAKVAVVARSEAAPGSFQVRVLSLASAQSLASEAFADQDASLGTGELTLAVGEKTAQLSFGPEGASLKEVRDAINGSGLAVRAVIVRDGEDFRLLLTSGKTGAAGELSLAVSGGLDSRLASAAMAVTAPAQDAAYTINGLTLSASSNVIEDAIPGVTLTLKAETDAALDINITADRQGARTRLNTMVTAFNRLVDNMAAAGRADPEGGNSGPLVGDATLRSVQSRIAGAFSAGIDAGADGGRFSTLLDLGLSTDLQGRARLDADRFAAALEEDQAGVEALVSAFAEGFATTLEGFSGPGGILGTRTDNLNAELRRIEQQRAALDQRMEQVEARFRAQFSALDSLLSQFQNTSAFLAQQLAGLANLRPGRN